MRLHIESLIFCSPEPVSVAEMVQCMRKLHGDHITREMVANEIEAITEQYGQAGYAFEVVQIAGGYRFLTKPACRVAVEMLVQEQSRKKLSAAALETLSIIAYRQPITKAELEQVRGVSCDYSVLKLLERELVAISGRKDGPGRPVLYTTTSRFLEHMGIRSLADLPPLPAEIHESVLGTPDEMVKP